MKIKAIFLILLAVLLAVAPAGKPLVVLPPQFRNSKVVVVGTEEFERVSGLNKEMSNAIVSGDKEFEAFKKKTDLLLNEKEIVTQAALEKARISEANTSWLMRLFGGSTLIALLFGAGMIALFIFNPAIFLSIVRIFMVVMKFIARLFGKGVMTLEHAISHINDYEPIHPTKTVALAKILPIKP